MVLGMQQDDLDRGPFQSFQWSLRPVLVPGLEEKNGERQRATDLNIGFGLRLEFAEVADQARRQSGRRALQT